ncbi:MAG: HD domain-containing protein [Chloroflexota bacterium]|nr:HD domain-containing protein [Chloroflexota bacterium]
MADVPLPGEELTPGGRGASNAIAAAVPAAVLRLLQTLWDAGHAAYVVGGSVRDVLMGRPATDWDLATSALPDEVESLFTDTLYENAFGTVAVGTDDPAIGEVEITTFRSDHDYADFRRPHRVEFSDSIALDLARRDVTVNAIAWGAPAGEAPHIVDPFGGQDDIAAALLRTVGDPLARFEEDALRMLRVVRFAATLGFWVDSATLAGMTARADRVRHVSGERIAMELARLLAAPVPSIGLRLMSDTGLLGIISPDLALQRGIPQNKIDGEDLWDHTLRAVDAAAVEPPYIRMAALLHDIGKPATMADGRFLGHDAVGADRADELLERLRWPRQERDRIVHVIRNHMYGYEPTWSDAAVRRFIAKVGREALDDLFLLREADNVGSGRPRDGGGLAEIRERVAQQLAAGVVLDLHDLDIDGDVLMAELGLSPSPRVGALLHALLERAVADPTVNRRDRLLALARSLLEDVPA